MARWGRSRGGGFGGYDGGFAPYVSVAERRDKAAAAIARRKGKGEQLAPVIIAGNKIAVTFWGKAWCDNLTHYGDFANRLPRGRSYVRNGAVIDLQIEPGLVRAAVCGSSMYSVTVKVTPLPAPRWSALCGECTGGIDSLVELLRGRFGQDVMSRLCDPDRGLFPAPAELAFDCSCPDWATMCKHVAAVCYGIGARLDTEPALLFKLRQVNELDLLAKASAGLPTAPALPPERLLVNANFADLFGLDFAAPIAAPEVSVSSAAKAKAPAKAKPRAPAKTKAAPAAKRAATRRNPR